MMPHTPTSPIVLAHKYMRRHRQGALSLSDLVVELALVFDGNADEVHKFLKRNRVNWLAQR